MSGSRKPIPQTNFFNVVGLSIIFAPLFGAVTEDLTVFIGAVLTVPILVILLLVIWLRFGYSGILVNSINAFIMIAMMSFYSSIPLFHVLWGSWVIGLLLGIYLVTFLIGYRNREKLIMKLSITKGKDGVRRPAKFLLYYALGTIVIGIIGIIIANTVISNDGGKIFLFGFFYLLSYYLFAVSPALLVNPKKAVDMGAITEEHYNQYH